MATHTKYRQGTHHNIAGIDQVAFGVSLFLTMIETADERARHYLGYSTTDIQFLLNEPYALEASELGEMRMMYHLSTDPWENKIQYDAEIYSKPQHAQNQKNMVGLIGHESDYMLNLQDDHKAKKFAGITAAIATCAMTGYGIMSQGLSFEMAGAASVAIAATAASLYNRTISYNAEVKAYTQQARIECYLGNHFSRSLALIEEEIEKTKPNIKTFKEIFVDNYPSNDQMKMIRLKTNQEALKTNAPTLNDQQYHELQRAAAARMHNRNIHVIS